MLFEKNRHVKSRMGNERQEDRNDVPKIVQDSGTDFLKVGDDGFLSGHHVEDFIQCGSRRDHCCEEQTFLCAKPLEQYRFGYAGILGN